jgi:hypothetical protein
MRMLAIPIEVGGTNGSHEWLEMARAGEISTRD